MSAATLEAIAPGIVTTLSNDEYHAITDWYSSSQLKAALPEHYKPGGSPEALAFGTLFHTVVLEPENLTDYVALDTDKIGLKSDGTPAQNPLMTVAWKRAVAEAEQDGKTVIAKSDWDRAHAMADTVREHDAAARLLFSDDGISEESAFAIDENGVQHKARFDRRIPGLIIDLKSTSAKPGARSLRRAVWDYGYETSAAHYLAVADLLSLDAQGFVWVFVEKTLPYRVTVAEIGDDLLSDGYAHRARAVARLTDPATDAYEGATGFLTL